MKYLIRMVTGAGSTPWEYPLDLPSDDMAQDYVRRKFETDMPARTGALRLDMFNIDEDRYIGSAVLDKPTARLVFIKN